LSKRELAALAAASAADLGLVWGYFLAKVHVDPLLLFIMSLAILGWLITRASEVSVEALVEFAEATGSPPYIAGVVSSLASNLPEIALIATALASKEPEVVEVAVLAVMISVGTSILLVSATTFAGSIKSGLRAIAVPKEALIDELNAVAFTLTAYLALTLVSMARLFTGGSTHLPRGVGVILVLSYISYVLTLASRAEGRRARRSRAIRHLLVALIGTVPVFVSAEVLVRLVEDLIALRGFDVVHAAMAIAVVGTVPENGVAIISAAKGEVEVGLGNTLSSVTILALLAVGIVGVVVPIPLDAYVVAQLGVTAASTLLLKFSIRDDGKIDVGEAIFMVSLQALAFDLLLT